jgi:hypothetical protein
MVIGALAVGAIAGLLVPSPKQPAASGSQASLAQPEKTEAKTKRERPAAAANETTQPTHAKLEKQNADACSQQSWPYYSPCLDRTATAAGPVRIVNTKPANPTLALSDEKERKAQAAALPPAPKRETRQQSLEAPAAAPAQTQTNRAQENSRQSSNEFNRQIEQERPRQQPRGQARITRVEPPENWDDEAPRVFLRGDGTRVYVVPETRHIRPHNGYWRSW